MIDMGIMERRKGIVKVKIKEKMKKGKGWKGNVILLRERVVRNVKKIKIKGVEKRGEMVEEMKFKEGKMRVIDENMGILKR